MTEDTPPLVGVPVIVPVVGLIDRPAGSPVADQVKVTPDWVSVAEFVTAAMGVPDTVVWAAWPATDTVLVTVQVNEVVPV